MDNNLNIRSYMGADDDTDIIVVSSEEYLLRLLTLLIIKLDPDIIGGWDQEIGSLSYVAKRADEYHIDILTDIGRA